MKFQHKYCAVIKNCVIQYKVKVKLKNIQNVQVYGSVKTGDLQQVPIICKLWSPALLFKINKTVPMNKC